MFFSGRQRGQKQIETFNSRHHLQSMSRQEISVRLSFQGKKIKIKAEQASAEEMNVGPHAATCMWRSALMFMCVGAYKEQMDLKFECHNNTSHRSVFLTTPQQAVSHGFHCYIQGHKWNQELKSTQEFYLDVKLQFSYIHIYLIDPKQKLHFAVTRTSHGSSKLAFKTREQLSRTGGFFSCQKLRK